MSRSSGTSSSSSAERPMSAAVPLRREWSWTSHYTEPAPVRQGNISFTCACRYMQVRESLGWTDQPVTSCGMIRQSQGEEKDWQAHRPLCKFNIFHHFGVGSPCSGWEPARIPGSVFPACQTLLGASPTLQSKVPNPPVSPNVHQNPNADS